jgi:purine-binding chemotaxis protein CheW
MNALATLAREDAALPVDSVGESQLLEVGLMRLCGRDLAVPAVNVREVVPMPERLHPSFSNDGASAGSIVIRGRVIPVLDVAERLGFGPREDGPGVVLILRHEQALIGLIMDLVSGLARVSQEQVQPFPIQGGEDLRIVSSSFPYENGLVGLIDPRAVFALPRVPHARDTSIGGTAHRGGGRRAVVLIAVADSSLALDASLVVATVPAVKIGPSPAASSKWMGTVHYLGQEIPVVDDLALFGLSGRAAEGSAGAVIILRLDEQRLLGVKIDQVRRILPVAPDMIRPLPVALGAQLTLFAGAITDHDGRQNLLLDGAALTRSDTLRMIGALSRAKSGAGQLTPGDQGTAKGVAGNREPFLVFRAGTRLRAAPLASVKQIIPLPEVRTGVRRAGSGLQGVASYNGAPLPLLGLSDGAQPSEDAEPVVLVVETGGAFNGLIVDRLETVARSVARPSPGQAGKSHFIEAQVGGRLEAVTVCDLAEEARRRA